MCTIGAIKTKNGFQIFKQLDLPRKTEIFQPEIRRGKAGKYLAFSRENAKGVWAAANEHGLTFVAADANCEKQFPFSENDKKRLFQFYEKITADFADLENAEKFIRERFENDFRVPDIVAIGNGERFILLKFHPSQIWERDEVSSGALFCTNHFCHESNLHFNVAREKDESTFLRLETAQELFAKGESLEAILQNHDNGPGEKSICRHGKSGEFFTQACVIFKIEKQVSAKFTLNAKTCESDFAEIFL